MAHFIKLDRYDRTRVLGKPWAMVTVELVARKRLQVQADSLAVTVFFGMGKKFQPRLNTSVRGASEWACATTTTTEFGLASATRFVPRPIPIR